MTSIGQKADYVRSGMGDRIDRRHTCHWPGCDVVVAPRVWGCRTHWYKLPGRIRRKIWDAFRPGQEVTKTPNAAYILAAREAQDWIKANVQQ